MGAHRQSCAKVTRERDVTSNGSWCSGRPSAIVGGTIPRALIACQGAGAPRPIRQPDNDRLGNE
eukprot:1526942-Prymnesium_polylepis.1